MGEAAPLPSLIHPDTHLGFLGPLFQGIPFCLFVCGCQQLLTKRWLGLRERSSAKERAMLLKMAKFCERIWSEICIPAFLVIGNHPVQLRLLVCLSLFSGWMSEFKPLNVGHQRGI